MKIWEIQLNVHDISRKDLSSWELSIILRKKTISIREECFNNLGNNVVKSNTEQI